MTSNTIPGMGGQREQWQKGRVFRHLPVDAINALERHGISAVYSAGQIVEPRGACLPAVGLVRDGNVRVSVLASDGRIFTLFDVPQGEIFVQDFDQGSDATAIIAESIASRTVITTLPAAAFLDAALAAPRASADLVELLWVRLNRLRNMVGELAHDALPTRIARTLVREAERHPVGLVDLSQSELANLVAGSREEVNRNLTRLRRAGLISYDGRRRGITVVDPGALLWV